MKKLSIISIYLLFSLTYVYSQDITNAGAIVLPVSGQTAYTVSSGATVNIVSGISVTLQPGTTLSGGSSVRIYINNIVPLPVPAPSNPSADADKNWVYERSYDESGNEIGATKQFFDNNGKPTQTQTRNETTGHVLASQTIYDVQGKGVLTTLAAPINNSAFAYNNNFITNSNNTTYDYTNFDWNNTFNYTQPYSKTNSPDPVNNSLIGSLGWYYSNNNTLEPMVGPTGYPYNRTDYFHDGTSLPKRSADVGDQLRMGTGHEVLQNVFPVISELDNYMEIRNQFFPAATVGVSSTSLAVQALQTLSVDQNGTQVVNITDLSGKPLMTGRADASGWLTVLNSFSVYAGNNDFETGIATGAALANTPTPTVSFSITSRQIVKVMMNGSVIFNDIGNNYVYSPGGEPPGGAVYSITSAYPFNYSSTYTDPNSSSGFSTNTDVPAPLAESSQSMQYFSLVNPSAVTITGSYRLINMLTETDITSGFTSGNTLAPGHYKVIANTGSSASVTYTNIYSDISYNYYNQLGQLIASIAPNGVQLLLKNPKLYPHTIPYATFYSYDLQGRLISSLSPDGGLANYIYRMDGKIRFSQNAYQANAANSGSGMEKFSYTNYDSFGRPIESGEYVTSAGTFAGLSGNTTVLEATDPTGGLSGGTKLSQVNTYYDLPATNLGLAGYMQDAGFLKGAVSYTSNANSTTWYNYDDHGRVTWMVKQLAGITGYKTVNYTYNYQGNVGTVDYQAGIAAERFIHYYSYDADGRLINVQTSTDAINKVQQANYYYYLHGPLKRTELGDQLQGIDYVYTPQGWLKTINTPTGNAANDPQQDGVVNSFAKDAFGMQLEYFPGDYNRTGSNVTSINTGQTAYYNGNVNGISWQSYKPSIVVSGDPTGTIQAPAMYTFTYDPKYQYNQSVWGKPNYSTNTFTPSSTNSFQEGNILYDANGNIQTMAHTDQAGNPLDYFSYNYNPNTNQLASVANRADQSTYGTYGYDEIGRLKSQINAGGPTYLKYDVTGKITGIYIDANYTTLKIGYSYDESGHRISSVNNTGSQPITTYYVYDASGNVLAIYTQSGSGTPQLAEQPVYGSSRLGTYYTQANNYVYEIRDNVGSVRVAINRRLNSSGQADIFKYNDYYPFGSNLGRNGGSFYRYDYQGAYSEKDPITTYNNFELRMYDSRIGRWLSTDPEGQYASPYEGMGNNPVSGSDPTGGEGETANSCCGDPIGIGWMASLAVWFSKPGSTLNPIQLDEVVVASTPTKPYYTNGSDYEFAWYTTFDNYMKTHGQARPKFGLQEYMTGGQGRDYVNGPQALHTEIFDVTAFYQLAGGWGLDPKDLKIGKYSPADGANLIKDTYNSTSKQVRNAFDSQTKSQPQLKSVLIEDLLVDPNGDTILMNYKYMQSHPNLPTGPSGEIGTGLYLNPDGTKTFIPKNP